MPKRILIVEDDLLNRLLYCTVLERSGFRVDAVDDGALAVGAARRFDPDLIIMDINLPNVSGLELIEMLRADPAFSGTPILAVTAYVGKGEEGRIREAGASEYMAKPISIQPLLAAVNRLLIEYDAGGDEPAASRSG